MPRFFDIGANLTDPVFRGFYRGKSLHKDDFDAVITRAKNVGVERIMVTAGRLSEVREALRLCESHPGYFFTTIGVHPTRCDELATAGHSMIDEFIALHRAHPKSIIAVGECGLDFDRLQFCTRQTQLSTFPLHFQLTKQTGLPMFLHNRNTGGEFTRVIEKYREDFGEGCVHSFDGSVDEMKKLVDLGLYIGVNGCSLKTKENLDTVKAIPMDRILFETDAPWCGITTTHASFTHLESCTDPTIKQIMSKDATVSKPDRFVNGKMVKSRSEPCHILKVAAVVASLKGVSIEEIARAAWENGNRCFVQGEST